jgi:hypothetical protein
MQKPFKLQNRVRFSGGVFLGDYMWDGVSGGGHDKQKREETMSAMEWLFEFVGKVLTRSGFITIN